MKKPICSLLALFTLLNGLAQHMYYDVEKILTKYNPADSTVNCGNDMLNLLGAYVENPDRDNIQNEFADNPFFRLGGCSNSSPDITPVMKMTGNPGGMHIEKYADGLAKFLVQRTKEELNVSFFRKFSEELQDTGKYGPINKLFPKTFEALKVIGDRIYQYQSYILMLRECFGSDLEHLDENMHVFLKSMINHSKYSGYFTKQPDLKGSILCAGYITHALINSIHPGEIIKKLPGNKFSNKDINATIELLRIVSESVKSKSEYNYWVDKDSVKALLNHPVKRNIFFGLIYQQSKRIVLRNGNTIGEHIQSVSNWIKVSDKLKIIIEDLIFTLEDISGNLKNMHSGVTREAYDYNWRSYVINITTVLKTVDEISSVMEMDNKTKVELGKFIFLTGVSNDLYANIKTKNYASALFNVITILDTVLTGSEFDYRSFLLKYGTFMINVTEAENSDQVKSAIEAIALPAGSASIKKYSPWSVSLNAYVGIYPWGKEYLANKSVNASGNIFGVAAPVGVAVSRGVRLGKKNWSLTAYGSLIDIGAFVSYRFKDTSSAALPEVKLQNIFAPGCGFIIGLPGLPVSVGGMWQAGPMLREINAASVKLGYDMNYRWTAFVAVDIPIVNFYAKERK